jgi:hypothetical protein
MGRTKGFVRQQGDPSQMNKVELNEGDMNERMMDYESVQCGYGKMTWPDQSTFEGFWVNGYPFGVGVFRSLNGEHFEGFWQQDR